MTRLVRIPTLAGNTAHGESPLAKHELAFWIKIGSKEALFGYYTGGLSESSRC